MTIAFKLTGLAFAAAATAAGATDTGQTNVNQSHMVSGPTTVNGSAANPGVISYVINKPIERTVDLGDCNGLAFQALFDQVVNRGQAQVETKSFFGTTYGTTTYTHSPNLTNVSATSFTLYLPGGPMLKEDARIEIGGRFAEGMLLSHFKKKQADIVPPTADPAIPEARVATQPLYTGPASNRNEILRPETLVHFTCKPDVK